VNVSILFVRMLLSNLRERNLPDAALLSGTSIDEATLSNLRATIPTERWVSLILRALELTGDPALGIALGESSPSMLQLVGQLIASCRTLRESLTVMQRYHTLLSNNTTYQLEERGEAAFLYCDDGISHPVAARTSLEATLGLAYSIGRRLVAVGSDEVWFQHAEPAYAKQYARVFACPVRFGQPRNALVFARSLLDITQPHGDDAVHEVLLASADALLRERESESFTERVRAMLRYENDIAHMNVRFVADRLHMKVRALRRRLTSEQSSITELLDEARLRIAQRELSMPGASIKEVAHRLGFSEASAFHRAFKRLSGQAPAQFIKEQSLSRGTPP
jgi:AraC-like DNA-binding protein